MGYLVYALICGLALWLGRFDDSPDQISYVNLAEQYAAGNWSEAINGFWSPLLSWLIALPVACGADARLAAKAICALAGLGIVRGVEALAVRMELTPNPWLMSAAALCAAAMAGRISADVLAAAVLLHYLADVWKENPSPLKTGVYGGLLYLVKNYLLFFFLLHWGIHSAGRLARHAVQREGIFQRAGLTLAGTALLAVPWVTILTQHYGKFTISRAGVVNLAMAGPESSAYRQHKVLAAPSSPSAFSALQDPPPEALPTWKPLSAQGAQHLAKVIKKNLGLLENIYRQESIFWMAILAGAFLAAGSSAGTWTWWERVLPIGLLPLGYLSVIVVDRYLWATIFLLLLNGNAVLEHARTHWKLKAWAHRTLAVIGLLSFCGTGIAELRRLQGSGHLEREIALKLRATLRRGERSLSCGSYETTLLISARLGVQYYGLVREGSEDRQYAREFNPNYDRSNAARLPAVPVDAAQRLQEFQPDWLFVWPSCEGLPEAVEKRIDPEWSLPLKQGGWLRRFSKERN